MTKPDIWKKPFLISFIFLMISLPIFYFFSTFYFNLFPVVVFFFLSLNIIIRYIFIKSPINTTVQFNKLFLTITLLKFLLCVLFLIIYLVFSKQNIISFIVVFSMLYVIFTVLEVQFLLNQIKLKNYR
jgi:hypothetical protein